MYVAGETMKLSHRLLVVVGLALAPISALQTYSAFRLEGQQTLATYAEAQRLLQLIEDEQAGTIEGIGQILGNCSPPGEPGCYAAWGSGSPSRVRRMAWSTPIDLRRAVSTTDRTLA
jgi:hypothetical protein